MSAADLRTGFGVIGLLAAALTVAAWDLGGISWARWPGFTAFVALGTAAGFAVLARDNARRRIAPSPAGARR
ncbi:hypothetical protein ABZY68_25585 [Streptomyces sp. NPDC006482]|uniref:hypothetical protein n=1 Tax=Streptomyces sp. NPDC006482 TaxID=3154306 RepID=UPI0033B629C0